MIDLVLGPMFAGKSTELLRKIKRYRVAEKTCLVIKYENDKRYSEKMMSTHDKQMIEAVSCTKLEDCIEKARDFDVVGIDEGQFFEDIVEFSEELANAGKIVIISALDSTFERKSFGRICELIPLCERVEKLDAVCMDCKGPAYFTKRTIDSKEIEVIGGAEVYKPVCRHCFQKDAKRRPLRELSASDVATNEEDLENADSSNVMTMNPVETKKTQIMA